MFKLRQSDSFSWPVTIKVPIDGGRYASETLDAEFRRLSQTDLAALWARLNASEITGREFVHALVCGWRGVTDDGVEVPFSPGNLDQLLEVTGATQSLMSAYGEALAGLARKN